MTLESLKGLEQLNELALTEEEKTAVLDLFDKMAEKESKLSSIDTENVEVMVHVHPMTNVFREDVRSQPFTREELLSGAPEHTDDCWQVPRLVK